MELNKSRDMAVGYALGYNDGLGQSGSSTDEWQFPEDWIDIPDPAPNQIVMLMDCRKYSVTPHIGLWCNGKYGGVTIDCGDGQVISFPENISDSFKYTYTEKGQYIMTITSDYIQGIYLGNPDYDGGCEFTLTAIKVGANMCLDDNSLSAHYGLVYAEFFGQAATRYAVCYNLECIKTHIPPTQLQDNCFNQCYNLKYLYNYLDELTVLPENCFDGTALEIISLPKVTSISYLGDSQHNQEGIRYCRNLKKVFAPLLTEISVNDFGGCYRLQELTLADNVNINGNTFPDCYLLR